MPEFVVIYHNTKMPVDMSPEEGEKNRAKFGEWLKELGDAVVNPGTPFGPSKMVSSDGVSDSDGGNTMMGFSMVKADSIDAAVELVSDCPFLDMGDLEVAEALQMG